MNVTESLPPRPRLSDRAVAGATTAAIMLVVQLAALWAVAGSDPVSAVDGAEQTRDSSGLPLGVVAVMVVEALLLVAGYRLYQRLSETWQRRVRRGLVATVYLIVTQLAYTLDGVRGVGVVVGSVALVWVAGRPHVDWLVHNAVAVGLAFAGAVLVGTIFGPRPLAGLLIALVVWDRIAVTDTDIMETIVKVAASSGLPAYIMLTRTPRLDTDDVEDALVNGGEMPDELVGVVGTGDFVFPSSLGVSLAISGGVWSAPVAGAAAGAVGAVWLLWQLKSDGAVPGLPTLNGGALAGAAVGVALSAGIG
jgi:presenilin-like A22 family membrane protease